MTTATEPARRGRPGYDRDSMLEVVVEAFNERGYDATSLGVLAELHKHGFRVPDDISLVALHDVWYADATWPPITTIRAPFAELGRAAVARVLDARPTAAPVHEVISDPAFELTVRASTAPPR